MVSRRLRIFIWIAVAVATVFIISTASVAFVVLRTLNSTTAPAAAAEQTFEDIRKLYPGRPPLIEVKESSRDVRINRTPNAPRKNVETLHFMMWDPEDKKLVRGEAPLWVTNMRVSIFGVANWSFSDYHVTREDIERYSPGLIVDFKGPDGNYILAWTR
jgi:hypothetical protein